MFAAFMTEVFKTFSLGFAAGYLPQPPQQGVYQGGWWVSHPPPQPSTTAVRQQMPQVNYTTMNNHPPPYNTNVQATTSKVNGIFQFVFKRDDLLTIILSF